MNPPFDIEDIDGVHIIVEAKGKLWELAPKPGRDVGNVNIALAVMLLESHRIVTPSLDEIGLIK